MPEPDKNTVFYDLTLSQYVVHYSLTYSPYKQAMNIAVCLYIRDSLDFDLLKKAVIKETERNDCMRLYFKKSGRRVRQYFIGPEEAAALPPDIAVADFTGKTKEEEDAFLLRDAAVPVRCFKGEICRFIFFKAHDGRNGLYFVVCHLNMDAMSVFLTLRDLLCVCRALERGTEMPKPFNPFKDYIIRELAYYKDGTVAEKNREYYLGLYKSGGEPLYCSPSGIGAMEKLRKKRGKPGCRSYPLFDPFKDRSENIGFHLTPAFTARIDSFCRAHSVSPQNLFLTALVLYVSKINGSAQDVCYTLICGRRPAMGDKYMSGCMASGSTLRASVDAGSSFGDTLRRISSSVTHSYRYTHFSSIEATFMLRKLYKLPVFDHYTSFMLSYLPFMPLEGWDYDQKWISNGRFGMGLYCIAVHNPSDGGYDLTYEYRVKMHSPEDVTALHAGMTGIIGFAMDDPEAAVSGITGRIK